MKKLFAIMLIAIMMVGLIIPSFAAESEPKVPGIITIDNAIQGKTYNIYRVFDLDSYDYELQAYIYKISEKWNAKEFVNSDAFKSCFIINKETGVVAVNGELTDKQKEDFAKAALAFAKDNDIEPEQTATAKTIAENPQERVQVVFDVRGNLGYYLLDSSVGALCSLDTSDEAVTIVEKNSEPSIDKKVEVSNGVYDKSNSAQIGDTVKYEVTITAGAGAQKYVFHDIMSDGLTFDGSVTVTLNGNGVAAEDYTLYTNPSDGDTFDVVFEPAFCNKLKENDSLVVTYTATINDKAEVKDELNNKAVLEYGEGHRDESEVITRTFKLQIIKTDAAGENGVYDLLTGAEFKLYRQEKGGEAVKFIPTATGYKVVTKDYDGPDKEDVTDTIVAGQPIIEGLCGEYWLEETKAPDGFNLIESRVPVTVTANNVAGEGAIIIATKKYNSSVSGGLQIQNAKGHKLPSTGSVGTVAIYVGGITLILLACGMLLAVSRRKESK